MRAAPVIDNLQLKNYYPPPPFKNFIFPLLIFTEKFQAIKSIGITNKKWPV